MTKSDPRTIRKFLSESISAVSESFQRHKKLIVLNLAGLFTALVLLSVVGQLQFGSTLYFYSDIGGNGRFGAGAMTVVSGMCLFVSGAWLISGARFLYIHRNTMPEASNRHWWFLIAGTGAIYLGLDEILMVHEYLTLKMDQIGVPKLFGIDQDLYIFAVYGIVAFVVLLKLFPSIYRYRNAIFPLVATIAFFALSEVVDMIPWDALTGNQKSILGPTEEILKTMGTWSAALYAELLLESIVSDVGAHFRQEDG